MQFLAHLHKFTTPCFETLQLAVRQIQQHLDLQGAMIWHGPCFAMGNGASLYPQAIRPKPPL